MRSALSRVVALLVFFLLATIQPHPSIAGFQWIRPLPQGNGLKDVAFLDDLTAIAVGDAGAVMVTHDGGFTWSVTNLDIGIDPLPARFTSIARVGALTAVACGAVFYRTTDAGDTWTLLTAPTGAVDVDFEGSVGIALWSSPLPREIRRSIDGGLSWSTVYSLPAANYVYVASVAPGKTYEYTLVVVDEDGSITRSMPVAVTIASVSLRLLPNRPNPFNPSTTIRFVIPERGVVRLGVYDIAGRHVATLVNEIRNAGTHAVEWNGTDDHGQPVASGVYLSRLESAKHTVSAKMMLIK